MPKHITKKRAVVYRRITGAKQGAESETALKQTESIKETAEALDLEIVSEFYDVGTSREGFSDLWGYTMQYAPEFLGILTNITKNKLTKPHFL